MPTLAIVGLLCFAVANGWYLTATAIAAVVAAVTTRRALRAAARRRAALRARADYEHTLHLAGDPRGRYGQFPPVAPGWFPDPGQRRQWRYFDGAFWTGHVAPR